MTMKIPVEQLAKGVLGEFPNSDYLHFNADQSVLMREQLILDEDDAVIRKRKS